MNMINKLSRKHINSKNRKKLKNKNFSLISSNCNGSFILHDLGLKFLSPTINLWMEPKDYIKFLQNLNYYINLELSFSDTDEEKIGYPVGILGDIKIYFQHYETRKEAKNKWLDICKRINYENLYIMFTDRDGCTYDDIKEFDNLPYRNKVIFVNKQYPEIKSSFYIKGFENMSSVGICSLFENKFSGKRYYDQFPYVKWFNGELY